MYKWFSSKSWVRTSWGLFDNIQMHPMFRINFITIKCLFEILIRGNNVVITVTTYIGTKKYQVAFN